MEELENRQLLALAADDSYSTNVNETLVVNADGAWGNDSYNASWETGHWECVNGETHEGYTDENGDWHDPWFECYQEEWIVDSTEYASGAIESWPSHGTLTYTEQGARAFTYEPETNYVGTDAFTYSINDNGGSSTATVTITILAPLAPPTIDAISDPAAINEDAGTQIIDLTGITAGGSESQELMVTATSSLTSLIPHPTRSYTSPNSTGSLSYAPVANAAGTATITVTVYDAGHDGIIGNADDAAISEYFSVTVDPVNDAPVLSGANNFATISEDDTNGSGDLVSTLISGKVTDVDAGALGGIAVTGLDSGTGAWQYSSSSGSTWSDVGSVSGTSALLLRSTDKLRFVPNGQSATSASVTFRAWDQTSGAPGSTVNTSNNGGSSAFSNATATSNLVVTAANDSPVLSGANDFTTVNEDQTNTSGEQVSALISGKVTDIDSGAASGIAVIGLSSGTGTWQYSTSGGSTWSELGLISGASALLLRTTDKLRFVPDAQNATSASVTFRAWDQTSGTAGSKMDVSNSGGSSAFSAATATSNLAVSAVNDAPGLSGANNFSTISSDQTSGSGELVSTLISGKVSDVDSGAVSGIAVTGLSSGSGTWQFSTSGGSTWANVGTVSSSSALLLRSIDKLRFVPQSQDATAGSITLRAWDQSAGAVGNKMDTSANGGAAAYSASLATSTITVTGANHAPVLTGANNFTTISRHQINGSGDLVSALTLWRASDVDGGAIGIAVIDLSSDSGIWQYSISGGSWSDVGSVSGTSALLLRSTDKLRFVPDGQNVTLASATFRAWDETSGTAGSKVDASNSGGTSALSAATATASIAVVEERIVDNVYLVAVNETLVVNANGAWENDVYHESWVGEEWGCITIEHHPAWTEEIYHDAWTEYIEHEAWTEYIEHEAWTEYIEHEAWTEYIEHETWTEEIYHEAWTEEIYHGAWTEEIYHEAWTEEINHEAWTEYIEHEAWDECLEPGMVPVTLYASGSIELGPSHGSLSNLDQGARSFTYTPDPDYTGPDSFTYSLCDDTGCDTATVTIYVGSPSGIHVSIGDSVVRESETLQFTVSLNQPVEHLVKVRVQTSDGSATEPDDYTSHASLVSFAPGQTTAIVSVRTARDAAEEDDENLYVRLSEAVGAEILDGEGQGIIHDTTGPEIRVDNAVVGEGGAFTLTVSLSYASSREVTVQYATANGTATAGADYTPHPLSTLTFAAGQTTKQIVVQTSQDTLDEDDETVFVHLTNPIRATLVKAQGVGLILDNDASPTITIDDPTVTEGGTLNFTLTLSAASGRPVSVQYSTADASAVAPQHYTAKIGTATFPPGAMTLSVAVPTINDALHEGQREMGVVLWSPANATLIRQEGLGTILENDTADVTINSFYSDGTNLLIDYTVTGTFSKPYSIAIYASPLSDGTQLQERLELRSGDTAPGSHTLTIAATFEDLHRDYFLVAMVDSVLQLNETNETNNKAVFNGGTFIATQSLGEKILHVHGNAQSETSNGVKIWQEVPATTPTAYYDLSSDNILNQLDVDVWNFNYANSTKYWQNPVNPLDVNNDTHVSAIDAVLIINWMNSMGATLLSGPRPEFQPFLDVNGDNVVSHLDTKVIFATWGNGQDIVAPWYNFANFMDVNADGTVNTTDLDVLTARLPKGYARIASASLTGVARIHIHTHGGDDVVDTGSSTGWIYGGAGNDHLTGGDNNNANRLYGGIGNDTLIGGNGGNNAFYGEDGDDLINGGDIDDIAYGGAGNDTIHGYGGWDWLYGGTGNDALYGEDGNDELHGGSGSNTLDGGAGTNVIDNGDIPTLTVSNVTHAENGQIIFTVTRSSTAGPSMGFGYRTYDGSATANVDYVPASAFINFATGSTTATIAVTLLTDSVVEGSEIFYLDVFNPANALITTGQATGTIQDDDLPNFKVHDISATEGGPQIYRVQLSDPSTQTTTVQYATANGTATNGLDYTGAGGVLSFPANRLNLHIVARTIQDTLDENDETVNLNLANPINATIGDGQGIGTILDDDAPPTISIDDVTVLENQTKATFTVRLSAPSGKSITVAYQTTDGLATAGSDYQTTSNTITFAPGQITKTFDVNLTGDSLDEHDETFFVNLSSPVNATISDSQGVATITDDDAMPTVSLQSNIQQSEGWTTMVFTATLSQASGRWVNVGVQATNGTAVAEVDYHLVRPTQWPVSPATSLISFAPGETSRSIFVYIFEDESREANETFSLELTNPLYANIGGTAKTGTILNDDAIPTLSIGDVEVIESAGVATFTVTVSEASGETITVNYATSDGTAIAAQWDYETKAGSVTFAPGEVEKTITVPVYADGTDEPNESFTVQLSAPQNATITDALANATILDSDVPYLLIEHYSANEATGQMFFTVRLQGPSYQTVTVDYSTADDTAVAWQDYTPQAGTLTFSPGQTVKTITVPIYYDGPNEEAEYFRVDLSNATNASLPTWAGPTAYGEIKDADSSPAMWMFSGFAYEGSSEVNVTVYLSHASNQIVTVDWATVSPSGAGSATAGSDYTAGGGTLTFPPGFTSQTFAIPILHDTLDELDEVFNFQLSNPTNATIVSAPEGVPISIRDNDGPLVSVAPAAATEGNKLNFVIGLSAPSLQPVRVYYRTVNGSAISSSDYLPIPSSSFSVLFQPGEIAKVVSVTTYRDAAVENDETVYLDVYSTTNGTLGAINPATNLSSSAGIGTIIDGTPLPSVSVADVSVSENGGQATVTVSLSTPSDLLTTVQYSIGGGTAVAWDDYSLPNGNIGNLYIPKGSTTATFTIDLVNDGAEESDEYISVSLQWASNAVLGDKFGKVTILNDDQVLPVTLGLSVDDGVSATDLFTSDPTIAGEIADLPATHYAVVEVDLNADGWADIGASVNPDGTFTFDASQGQPWLYGKISFSYRATIWNELGEPSTGKWKSFSFTLEPLPSTAEMVILSPTGTEMTAVFGYEDVHFGTTFSGDYRTVTVRNDGTDTLYLHSLSGGNDIFSVNWSTGVTAPEVPPGGQVELQIGFFGTEPGVYRRGISFRSTDGDERSVVFWVEAVIASPGPEIDVRGPLGSPISNGGSYTGGLIFTPTPHLYQVPFEIFNRGEQDLILDPSALLLPDAGVTLVSGFALIVVPGSSTSFTIQYDTSVPRLIPAEIVIVSNDADEGRFRFNISKQVVPYPAAPSPALSDLRLQTDTEDPTDRITTVPIIAGRAAGYGPGRNFLVEFDLNNDGFADSQVTADPDAAGDFVMDLAPYLTQPGPVSVKTRAVFRNPGFLVDSLGVWQEFAFTWVLTPEAVGIESSLQLVHNLGTAAAPVSRDGLITGVVTNDGAPLAGAAVEIDIRGDERPEGYAFTDSDGKFTFDLLTIDPRPEPGTVTVNVRALQFDPELMTFANGDRLSLTFTLLATSNRLPTAAILGLTDAGNLIVPGVPIYAPRLTGLIGNPDGTLLLTSLELDWTGDDTPEYETANFNETTGNFTLDLSDVGLPDGPVTLRIRASEFDEQTGTYLTSGWSSVSFVFEPPVVSLPEVRNLALVRDTDIANDGITADPRISGEIWLPSGPLQGVEVEYDLDGDAIADGRVYTQGSGSGQFSLDLLGLVDPGDVTVALRVGSVQGSGQVVFSEWTEFTFDYDPLAISLLQVATLSLAEDTGTPGDGLTTNPRILGALSAAPATGQIVRVEYELSGATTTSGSVLARPEDNGQFTVPLNPGSLLPGAIVFRARTAVFDTVRLTWDEGAWEELPFTFETPANSPPVVVSLDLVNDTAPAGDLSTTDARIKGTVLHVDGSTNNVPVRFDFNGDEQADGTVNSAATGAAEFIVDLNGRGLETGDVTVRFVAGELAANGQYEFGSWETAPAFTFHYVASDPRVAATVTNLSVLNDTGESGQHVTTTAVVTGTLLGNASSASILPVEYSLTSNFAANSLVYTNPVGDGTFKIDLRGRVLPGTDVTLYARSFLVDPVTGQRTNGEAEAITFRYEADKASSLLDSPPPLEMPDVPPADPDDLTFTSPVESDYVDDTPRDPSGGALPELDNGWSDVVLGGQFTYFAAPLEPPPAGSVHTVVVVNIDETVTNDDGNGNIWVIHTVINSTLTTDSENNGAWTIVETLVSTYTITTTYDGPNESYYTLVQSGSHNYTFTADGDEDEADYWLDEDRADEYSYIGTIVTTSPLEGGGTQTLTDDFNNHGLQTFDLVASGYKNLDENEEWVIHHERTYVATTDYTDSRTEETKIQPSGGPTQTSTIPIDTSSWSKITFNGVIDTKSDVTTTFEEHDYDGKSGYHYKLKGPGWSKEYWDDTTAKSHGTLTVVYDSVQAIETSRTSTDSWSDSSTTKEQIIVETTTLITYDKSDVTTTIVSKNSGTSNLYEDDSTDSTSSDYESTFIDGHFISDLDMTTVDAQSGPAGSSTWTLHRVVNSTVDATDFTSTEHSSETDKDGKTSKLEQEVKTSSSYTEVNEQETETRILSGPDLTQNHTSNLTEHSFEDFATEWRHVKATDPDNKSVDWTLDSTVSLIDLEWHYSDSGNGGGSQPLPGGSAKYTYTDSSKANGLAKQIYQANSYEQSSANFGSGAVTTNGSGQSVVPFGGASLLLNYATRTGTYMADNEWDGSYTFTASGSNLDPSGLKTTWNGSELGGDKGAGTASGSVIEMISNNDPLTRAVTADSLGVYAGNFNWNNSYGGSTNGVLNPSPGVQVAVNSSSTNSSNGTGTYSGKSIGQGTVTGLSASATFTDEDKIDANGSFNIGANSSLSRSDASRPGFMTTASSTETLTDTGTTTFIFRLDATETLNDNGIIVVGSSKLTQSTKVTSEGNPYSTSSGSSSSSQATNVGGIATTATNSGTFNGSRDGKYHDESEEKIEIVNGDKTVTLTLDHWDDGDSKSKFTGNSSSQVTDNSKASTTTTATGQTTSTSDSTGHDHSNRNEVSISLPNGAVSHQLHTDYTTTENGTREGESKFTSSNFGAETSDMTWTVFGNSSTLATTEKASFKLSTSGFFDELNGATASQDIADSEENGTFTSKEDSNGWRNDIYSSPGTYESNSNTSYSNSDGTGSFTSNHHDLQEANSATKYSYHETFDNSTRDEEGTVKYGSTRSANSHYHYDDVQAGTTTDTTSQSDSKNDRDSKYKHHTSFDSKTYDGKTTSIDFESYDDEGETKSSGNSQKTTTFGTTPSKSSSAPQPGEDDSGSTTSKYESGRESYETSGTYKQNRDSKTETWPGKADHKVEHAHSEEYLDGKTQFSYHRSQSDKSWNNTKTHRETTTTSARASGTKEGTSKSSDIFDSTTTNGVTTSTQDFDSTSSGTTTSHAYANSAKSVIDRTYTEDQGSFTLTHEKTSNQTENSSRHGNGSFSSTIDEKIAIDGAKSTDTIIRDDSSDESGTSSYSSAGSSTEKGDYDAGKGTKNGKVDASAKRTSTENGNYTVDSTSHSTRVIQSGYPVAADNYDKTNSNSESHFLETGTNSISGNAKDKRTYQKDDGNWYDVTEDSTANESGSGNYSEWSDNFDNVTNNVNDYTYDSGDTDQGSHRITTTSKTDVKINSPGQVMQGDPIKTQHGHSRKTETDGYSVVHTLHTTKAGTDSYSDEHHTITGNGYKSATETSEASAPQAPDPQNPDQTQGFEAHSTTTSNERSFWTVVTGDTVDLRGSGQRFESHTENRDEGSSGSWNDQSTRTEKRYYLDAFGFEVWTEVTSTTTDVGGGGYDRHANSSETFDSISGSGEWVFDGSSSDQIRSSGTKTSITTSSINGSYTYQDQTSTGNSSSTGTLTRALSNASTTRASAQMNDFTQTQSDGQVLTWGDSRYELHAHGVRDHSNTTKVESESINTPTPGYVTRTDDTVTSKVGFQQLSQTDLTRTGNLQTNGTSTSTNEQVDWSGKAIYVEGTSQTELETTDKSDPNATYYYLDKTDETVNGRVGYMVAESLNDLKEEFLEKIGLEGLDLPPLRTITKYFVDGKVTRKVESTRDFDGGQGYVTHDHIYQSSTDTRTEKNELIATQDIWDISLPSMFPGIPGVPDISLPEKQERTSRHEVVWEWQSDWSGPDGYGFTNRHDDWFEESVRKIDWSALSAKDTYTSGNSGYEDSESYGNKDEYGSYQDTDVSHRDWDEQHKEEYKLNLDGSATVTEWKTDNESNYNWHGTRPGKTYSASGNTEYHETLADPGHINVTSKEHHEGNETDASGSHPWFSDPPEQSFVAPLPPSGPWDPASALESYVTSLWQVWAGWMLESGAGDLVAELGTAGLDYIDPYVGPFEYHFTGFYDWFGTTFILPRIGEERLINGGMFGNGLMDDVVLASGIAADIGIVITEVTGMFDPTPISDGINVALNLARGNYLDAGVSFVFAFVPGGIDKAFKLQRRTARAMHGFSDIATGVSRVPTHVVDEGGCFVGETLVVLGYAPASPGTKADAASSQAVVSPSVAAALGLGAIVVGIGGDVLICKRRQRKKKQVTQPVDQLLLEGEIDDLLPKQPDHPLPELDGPQLDDLCDHLFGNTAAEEWHSDKSTPLETAGETSIDSRGPELTLHAVGPAGIAVGTTRFASKERSHMKTATARRCSPLKDSEDLQVATRRPPGLWLACWLLLALGLFGLPLLNSRSGQPSPGTRAFTSASFSAPSKAKFITQPIKDVQVGQWVLANNPELSDEDSVSESGDVDPATWRSFHFRLAKEDGNEIHLDLLRPLDWLQSYGASEPGATIDLHLDEIGVEGPAQLQRIQPCPSIRLRPSTEHRLVTGKFAHGVKQIVDLHIEGLTTAIQCTPNHPFWSDDAQRFLRADQLRAGETLRTAADTTVTLVSMTVRQSDEPVFNLEVEGEHVYYVSTSGVLVHNACPLFGKKGPTTRVHHIVSHYSNSKRGFQQPWSQMGQQILRNADINPKNSRWNKIHLPNHKGPHPEINHEMVYNRLAAAVRTKVPHSIGYKEAVRVEIIKLARDILNNPAAFGL